MNSMSHEEYLEDCTEGGEPEAGYWNRVIDFAHQNFDPEFEDDDPEPRFSREEWRNAEYMAQEYLEL